MQPSPVISFHNLVGLAHWYSSTQNQLYATTSSISPYTTKASDMSTSAEVIGFRIDKWGLTLKTVKYDDSVKETS